MDKGIPDIGNQLRKIFRGASSGDTLNIWDNYFFAPLKSKDFNELIQVFKDVHLGGNINSKLKKISVHFNIKKLSNYLPAIQKMGMALKECGINLETTGYDYQKDRKNRIHGRYWFSNDSGFLLDGSVNGIGINLCVGYMIDEADLSKNA
jgi:hypothetical protein